MPFSTREYSPPTAYITSSQPGAWTLSVSTAPAGMDRIWSSRAASALRLVEKTSWFSPMEVAVPASAT